MLAISSSASATKIINMSSSFCGMMAEVRGANDATKVESEDCEVPATLTEAGGQFSIASKACKTAKSSSESSLLSISLISSKGGNPLSICRRLSDKLYYIGENNPSIKYQGVGVDA